MSSAVQPREYREYSNGPGIVKFERIGRGKVLKETKSVKMGIKNTRKPVETNPGHEKGRGWKKLIMGGLVVLFGLVLLEVVFQLFITPYFTIKEVRIQAEEGMALTNEQIIKVAGLSDKSYYFNIKPEVIVERLEAFPLIREAKAVKEFPDTLFISVSPRKPLAVSLVTTKSFSVPLALDANGVVFQIGSSVKDLDVPVISGVQFKELELGMKLPDQLVSFLKDLEYIKTEAPLLFSLISEIQFVRKGDTDFEVLLRIIHYPLPVRIGAHMNEYLLKYILVTLDVVMKQDFVSNVRELDFRNGEVVYRMKEE